MTQPPATQTRRHPTRRMYLDESGDHSACEEAAAIGQRFLGLVGVVFERGATYDTLAQDLEALKKRHFTYDPDDPLVFHREDIVHRRGAFGRLKETAAREAFDDDLIQLIGATTFRVVAVVIDKATHARKTYRHLRHPYHYCLQALLERYCGWLNFGNFAGDVMAESRGKVEDRALKEAYQSVHQRGIRYLKRADAQCALTSREIKLKPKNENIAGLQVADLLANPITRDVLVAYDRLTDRGGAFADRVAGVVAEKYNRQVYQNRVMGYG